MRSVRITVVGSIFGAAAAVVFTTTALAAGSLIELAAAGRWDRVLEVALRREGQLPLSQEEVFLAAHASRMLGDSGTEERFLAAAAVEATELGRLARVQLARLMVDDDPGRAVDLAMGSFGRELPWPLRELAANVAIEAVARGIDSARTRSLERAAPRLTDSLERRLKLALAFVEVGDEQRVRLEKMLAESMRDLVALEAAERLAKMPEPSSLERWRVAATWYWHAMYPRAETLLEGLAGGDLDGVRRDHACFLRGRCAFRLGRWDEAADWYARAIALATSNARRAEYEVHLGRARELAGDLDAAVESAVRALRFDTSDERRLFLARLRLRRGEAELARLGISRLRSRASKDRGQMILGVDALNRGDGETAAAHFGRVRGRTWSGPAAIMGASLALGQGRGADAVAALQDAALRLDGFWVAQARTVMASLPRERLEAWRGDRRIDVTSKSEHSRWRALGQWGALEPEPTVRAALQRQVVAESFAEPEAWVPDFDPGLAAELWRLGLEAEAARWDPTGFPGSSSAASAWSAARFAELGLPWRATRVADFAWRQAGSQVPEDLLPESLRQSLYPLPMSENVRAAGAAAGVEWPLLAAVAREESRWDRRALSAAGARGLLQLMPETAATVASRLGRARPEPDDLFDAGLNLELGATELSRLVAAFGGRRAPAVAAYNAGEAQARLWLEQCGRGCSDAVYLVIISFSSTRTYTANVLAGASRYAELYGSEKTPASLTPDSLDR